MISVIGAGPVGCVAASSGIKRGYEVTLFEYQNPKKRRVQCAGLVSKSGLKRLGISSLPKDVILNKVRGAKIFYRSYSSQESHVKEFTIDGKETKAYVLDRRKFDNFLLNKALDFGVKFRNERVVNLSTPSILKKTHERIVIATGTNYNLHRKLNLDIPNEFLLGAQYVMNIETDPEFVELHFDIIPEFFSWMIPLDETYARVGLCTWRDPISHLNHFVKHLKREGRIKKNEKIIEKNFGVIPVYKPNIKTEYNDSKIVTVGDAASQVKATTGGGIVMGCLAAKFSSIEKDYEKKWKKEIGRELYFHLLIRRFLNKLSEQNLGKLLSLINEEKEIIEKKGDMDFASNVIFGLGRNPKFVLKFFSVIPHFLGDLV
jgi:flavin-dependent dehydrogenase